MPVKNHRRLCVQCCLSSFLFDQGIQKTPFQIVCEQSLYCSVGRLDAEGVIDNSILPALCLALGINLQQLPSDYTIQKSDEDGSLLIGLKWREGGKDNRHMVRFDRFGDNPDSIGIMDPDDCDREYTWRAISWFEGKTVTFYRIRLL